MGRTVILTDALGRGERLARNLGGGPSLVLHDLYGDAEPPRGAALVISDVSALTSDAVLRLRRTLAVARDKTTPFLALIHGNLGRGEIQATALGATRTGLQRSGVSFQRRKTRCWCSKPSMCQPA